MLVSLVNSLFRALLGFIELLFWLNGRLIAALAGLRLSWLAIPIYTAIAWVIIVFVLVYPVAWALGVIDITGYGGALEYTNERARGTAVFDTKGRFVGMIDPRFDSQRDLYLGNRPLVAAGHTIYPDHKSLFVDEAPSDFWACLKYHEDRAIGGWLNPSGIHFTRTLRMPLSTIVATARSFRRGEGLSLGAGGSTLAMQLVRSLEKRLDLERQSIDQTILRKLREYVLAPVLHRKFFTEQGEATFARFAANHLPMANRVGGGTIFGVGLAGRLLFGKAPEGLSTAEQYILASSVNRPVGVLPSTNEKIEDRRMRAWRYVVTTRAKLCVDRLQVGARAAATRNELRALAASPPPLAVDPAFREFLEGAGPRSVRTADPFRRAFALLGKAQNGIVREMIDAYSVSWRGKVAAVTTSLDPVANSEFAQSINSALARLSRSDGFHRVNPALVLDASEFEQEDNTIVPFVVMAAADEKGRLVRYYENHEVSLYFGSSSARDIDSRVYEPSRESLQIASIAKVLAAIAIGNDGGRASDSYLDRRICSQGRTSCQRICQTYSKQDVSRPATTAFACSFNDLIGNQLRSIPPSTLGALVRRMGFSLASAGDTPLATALSGDGISGSPRTVQNLMGMLLRRLENNLRPAHPPTLLVDIEETMGQANDVLNAAANAPAAQPTADPTLVSDDAARFAAAALSAPLCAKEGTLSRLARWCATRNQAVETHIAKTGTYSLGSKTRRFSTINMWTSGAIRFSSGKAYSYVVFMGTADARKPIGRFSAGRALAPLLDLLLEELQGEGDPDAAAFSNAGKSG